jgi:periplasmic divalent cation tolerance protein
MDCVTLYSTWPDPQSALNAGKAVVEQRLVACANLILAIQSVFIWDGKVQTDSEAVLICKTTATKAIEARDALLRLHPYELPCIVALPFSPGLSHAPFLQWIEETVISRDPNVGDTP